MRTNQDKVIVKCDPPIEKIGSIFVPEVYQSTLWSGTIIVTGPGRITDKGKFIPMSLHVGDRVIIDTARAMQLTYEGEELMVTREDEIMGTITSEGEVLTWKNSGRPTRKEWEESMYLTQRGQVRRVVA